MLNETWRLWQALERSKINCSCKHKRIQTPGRTSPCVRVCLDTDGKIGSVQDISNDEWPTWTVMEGNQNSFPVVRIQEPLYHLGRDHEAWAKLGYDANKKRRRPPAGAVRLDILESILKSAEPHPISNRALTLWRRLRDEKAKELTVCAETDPQMKPVVCLSLRFTLAKPPEMLLGQVAREAVAGLRQDRLKSIDAVEQLLVGKGPPDKNGKLPAMTVQLAFDIEDDGEKHLRLYSQKMRDRLIQVLPYDPPRTRQSQKTMQQKREEIDALSGDAAELEKRTFPKVELPVPSAKRQGSRIGRKRFPLASMFSEARCNTRYGMTDAGVFPLSKTVSFR